jgi:hypothetical protein
MPVEYGVHDVPIELAASLEQQRAWLRSALLSAQGRLAAFALKHSWRAHIQAPFARLFHVYADKASFDHDLLELCSLDPSIELPPTYCAALEQGVLMSVSPELYRKLYPQGDEERAFEKLLTHEMAHRLHIRVLGGDEEAMGPVWFYEGFALYAAGQFEKTTLHLTAAETWEVVSAEERGDYRRYASVFRRLAARVPLQLLVEMAGKADFDDWLRQTGIG